MNFIDSYDVNGVATPPVNNNQQTQASLNEEVNEVIGQLGRFWGGFRKQSQVAIENARKEVTKAAAQAQKELNKLATEASQTLSGPADNTPTTSSDSPPAEERSSEPDPSTASSSSVETPTSPAEAATPIATSAQNLFARFQASLPSSIPPIPPNIASAIQARLPEAMKDASGNVDFTQIRTSLNTEFQRVQGVTRTQAEEYSRRSEALLRDAMKEAGEFLKDAVKIVPPSDSEDIGVVWDGSDVWMLPTPGLSMGAAAASTSASASGSAPTSGRPSGELQRAAGTRAEMLLTKLRTESGILQIDPEVDERIGGIFKAWLVGDILSKDGGITGEYWSAKKEEALADGPDGEALKTSHDSLVPEVITDDVFWTRYFFRVYQIEQDEERRKALLQGTMEKEEEISWEDEEEEVTSPTGISTKASLNTLKQGRTAPSAEPSSTTLEPSVSRDSSDEGSYDVVSSNVSTSGEGEGRLDEVEKKKVKKEDEEDDDWE